MRQQDGRDRGAGSDQVEAEDGRAARHASCYQPVGEMIRVADERTLSAREANDAHHDQVVKRQGENDQRGQDRVPPGGEILPGT